MYNYDFKNEVVLYENNNALVEINGKEIYLSLLITDKNILLFNNLANDFMTKKSMGICTFPKYELLLKLNMNNIKYKCLNNNTIINDEEIILYDISLDKIVL